MQEIEVKFGGASVKVLIDADTANPNDRTLAMLCATREVCESAYIKQLLNQAIEHLTKPKSKLREDVISSGQ